MQMRGMFAVSKTRKNNAASNAALRRGSPLSGSVAQSGLFTQCHPERDRYVQGGCPIIKSHFWPRISRTSH